MNYIALDAHKRYTLASVERAEGGILREGFGWDTSQLYDRIAQRKGHQKAIGAVSRHLAEATYWMLKRKQLYQEPKRTVPVCVHRTGRPVSSTGA